MGDLSELKATPCSETIKELEGLLERFKTGELQEYMIVIMKSDGGTLTSWSMEDRNAARLIGELMIGASGFSMASQRSFNSNE